jgi:hypothetical protein
MKRSKLELTCQIREPHAWTRRTGLKVPSGLGAFLQTTRKGDKGSCYFLFLICYLLFAICYFAICQFAIE